MLLFYTDQYELPLPPEHKFPMRKYRMVRELIQREANGMPLKLRAAPLGSPDDVRLAHDPEYVAAVLNGTLDAAAIRRIGFPWSRQMVDRTLASAGATLAATQQALEGKTWAGTLSGGTHHAFRSEGSGFCVFNDIAIAILWVRRNAGVQRAAVIDLDVHQGDGTAQIFNGDADVLTTSLHCRSNFPFRKQQSSIDVELERGTGGADYLAALDKLLLRIGDWCAKNSPGVIFYQAGADPLLSDSLGHLALTHDGLLERDRRVFEFASRTGVPLVITQGGGYAKPIEDTVRAHANTFLLAARLLHSRA